MKIISSTYFLFWIWGFFKDNIRHPPMSHRTLTLNCMLSGGLWKIRVNFSIFKFGSILPFHHLGVEDLIYTSSSFEKPSGVCVCCTKIGSIRDNVKSKPRNSRSYSCNGGWAEAKKILIQWPSTYTYEQNEYRTRPDKVW